MNKWRKIHDPFYVKGESVGEIEVEGGHGAVNVSQAITAVGCSTFSHEINRAKKAIAAEQKDVQNDDSDIEDADFEAEERHIQASVVSSHDQILPLKLLDGYEINNKVLYFSYLSKSLCYFLPKSPDCYICRR